MKDIKIYKTFDDLVFEEHNIAIEVKKALKDTSLSGLVKDILEKNSKAKHAVVKFNNGIKLSVVFGSCFYSNGVDTYEAMVLKNNSEPKGYLTKEEVTKYMKELQDG